MLKKILFCFVLSLIIFDISCISTSAQEISDIEESVDALFDSLSEQVQDDLKYINADTTSISKLNNISFESIVNLILNKLSSESVTPMSCCAVVIAVLLLNALIDSYKDSLRQSSMREVLSTISTLCITATLVVPVINLINYAVATIKDASDFMLLYIPIMLSILVFSGHAVTSASYYSLMVMACQGVSQLASKVISPLLNVYIGFCISSSITDRVNLKGFCQMFSKIIKWLISFSMTVFSALLTIRGMITTAYDSVTARAVRFTMSSFIPIVGAALSESYKTIQGSINLLRTGAGVFVILAICVVFLPVVAQCLMWLFSVNICKSIGQTISVTTPVNLLSAISSVISIVFAIIVCIMAIFVIATALLITLGGGGT